MKIRNCFSKALSLICALALLLGNTANLFEIKTNAENAAATTLDFSSTDQATGNYDTAVNDGKLLIRERGAWSGAYAVVNYQLKKSAEYEVTVKYSCTDGSAFHLWAAYGKWLYNDYSAVSTRIQQLFNSSPAVTDKCVTFSFTADQPDGYGYLAFYMQADRWHAAVAIDEIVIKEILPEPEPEPGTVTLDFSSEEQLIGNQKSSVSDGKLSVGPLGWAWDNARAITSYKLKKGVTYDVTVKYSAGLAAAYNFYAVYGKSGTGGGVTNGDSFFKQLLSAANLSAGEEKSATFSFAANQPDGYDYLGFRMQGNKEGAVLLIDEVQITMHEYITISLEPNGGTLESNTVVSSVGTTPVLPKPKKEGYFFKGWYLDDDSFEIPADEIEAEDGAVYYAKWREIDSSRNVSFTFDEDDTDYWTHDSTDGNSAAADGGYLAFQFAEYKTHLVTLDYKLKSNSKYVLYYEFRCSNNQGTFNSPNSTIVTTAGYNTKAAVLGVKLATFADQTTDWKQIGTDWTKRAVAFSTGAIEEGNDKLAFRMGFGKTGELQIDNIKIMEITDSSDVYTEDFSGDANGLVNLAPGTDMAVVVDPDDAENRVIALHKDENKSANYKIVLPVTLKADTGYTLTYRYKASVADQGVSDADKICILGSNGAAKDLGYTVANAANNSGWGHIYNDWEEKTVHFTLSETEIGAGIPALYLTLYCESGSKYVPESYVYIDDIAVIPDKTITFVSNGGTVVEPISVPARSVIELPVPAREGWIFKGWCSDEALNNLVDNNAPESDVTYYARWYVRYDASGNGTVDAEDLTVLRELLLGVQTEYSKDGVYINEDDVIDILDLVRLKKILANSYTSYIPEGYNLVWAEEFNASDINETKLSGSTAHSVADNTVMSGENISLENGKAVLTTNYDSATGKYVIPYSLSTGKAMNFKHGYVEIRARVPFDGRCEWPAIWSIDSSAELAAKLPGYTAGEYKAEIDIMEQMNTSDSFQSQIHLWDNDGTEHLKNIWGDKDPSIIAQFDSSELANEWHTYGYKWTESGITVYVDGKAVIAKDFGNYADNFNVYMPLILSLQNYETDAAFSASMEIDYIRLYQNPTTDKLLVSGK